METAVFTRLDKILQRALAKTFGHVTLS